MAHRVVSLAGADRADGESESSPRRAARTTPPLPRSSRPSSVLRTPVPSRVAGPLRTPAPVRAATAMRTPAPSRAPTVLRTPAPSRATTALRTPGPSRAPVSSRAPARAAAASQAPAEQAYADDDLEASFGFSLPRPEPKLVVPIIGPSAAHPIFTRPAPSPAPALPPIPDAPTARVLPTFTREILPANLEAVHEASSTPSAIRPRPRRRWADFFVDRARTLEVLGFVVAWVLTVGAAAVVVGHVLEHSEMPAVVWLPTATPAAPSNASCSSTGQPPEVAVDSLPPATTCEAPRGPAAAAPARTPAPRRAAYPAQRAPAPTGAKTLGDWMRDAVR